MNSAKEQAIFAVAGIPQRSGHFLERRSEHADAEVFSLHNKEGTPYLLCGFPLSSEDCIEDVLRDSLAKNAIVSVAISFQSHNIVSKILRKSFRTGDVDYIASLETPTLLSSSHQLSASDLQLLTTRLENVLFEVHSAFRDIDGLHAPDALDEICKLLYAKLFDEENCVKAGYCSFQRLRYHSAEECAAEIRQLYLCATSENNGGRSDKSPTNDRSRGVFRDPLLLSSAAIVRAVELLQHYDISHSPVDIKGRAFQNVLLPAVRAGMGQYFTPKPIIEFIVDIMRPDVRDVLIDPFCGSAHFLTAALDYVRHAHSNEEKLLREFATTKLHGIEKSDRMVRIAMTDMRLHGDGHSNIRCIDALLPFSNYPDLQNESFDLVMTNPPFGIDLPAESISQLGPFSIAAEKRSSVSLEIVALERCLQLLRPGGRLAIVLPDSVLSNRNTAHVRQWIAQRARIRGIFSLPVETFSPFGANIKTSVLVVRKFESHEASSSDYRVFICEVDSIGYDGSGRSNPSSELKTVGQQFGLFIKSEGW